MAFTVADSSAKAPRKEHDNLIQHIRDKVLSAADSFEAQMAQAELEAAKLEKNKRLAVACLSGKDGATSLVTNQMVTSLVLFEEAASQQRAQSTCGIRWSKERAYPMLYAPALHHMWAIALWKALGFKGALERTVGSCEFSISRDAGMALLELEKPHCGGRPVPKRLKECKAVVEVFQKIAREHFYVLNGKLKRTSTEGGGRGISIDKSNPTVAEVDAAMGKGGEGGQEEEEEVDLVKPSAMRQRLARKGSTGGTITGAGTGSQNNAQSQNLAVPRSRMRQRCG